MELVILMGIQGSGKSTFCRERFFDTHVRINLDMLRTRRREGILFNACLQASQPMVIDNTNPAASDRQRYIPAARAARFRVVGYYFDCPLGECLERNKRRTAKRLVPERAVAGTHTRFEVPTVAEGFDELYRVRNLPDGRFDVEPM